MCVNIIILFLKHGYSYPDLVRSESNSPGFYHFCVRQFMKFITFLVTFLFLCSLFLFNDIPGWDAKNQIKKEKE